MNYQVQITSTAKNDLRDISIYIFNKSQSKDIAKRFINELKEKCNTLSTFPNRGSNPKDSVLVSNGYKYIVHKEYLIFYIINEADKIVYVTSIFNAKMDYFRILNG